MSLQAIIIIASWASAFVARAFLIVRLGHRTGSLFGRIAAPALAAISVPVAQHACEGDTPTGADTVSGNASCAEAFFITQFHHAASLSAAAAGRSELAILPPLRFCGILILQLNFIPLRPDGFAPVRAFLLIKKSFIAFAPPVSGMQ
jgi:hypothetical protein